MERRAVQFKTKRWEARSTHEKSQKRERERERETDRQIERKDIERD